MSTSNAKRLQEFVSGPFASIGGWCNPYIFQALQPIAEFQMLIGLDTPIAEIGVFQGKFFLSLVKAVSKRKGHHAFDVFDLQQFNLDFAGEGNFNIFKKNIEKSGEELSCFEFVRCDSTALKQSEIKKYYEKINGFSMFSVDGCHMAEHTISDLGMAMELTNPAGVIFVDDYYNPSWPGVQEGVCKLYHSECPMYVPFVFAANKLILCHIGYHQNYLAAVSSFVTKNFPQTKIKYVTRFGYKTATLLPDPKSTTYLV